MVEQATTGGFKAQSPGFCKFVIFHYLLSNSFALGQNLSWSGLFT